MERLPRTEQHKQWKAKLERHVEHFHWERSKWSLGKGRVNEKNIIISCHSFALSFRWNESCHLVERPIRRNKSQWHRQGNSLSIKENFCAKVAADFDQKCGAVWENLTDAEKKQKSLVHSIGLVNSLCVEHFPTNCIYNSTQNLRIYLVTIRLFN